MAVVYPLANGNWSTVANWYSGGVPYGQLPQPTDTVDLNAKVILLDTNVSVTSITSASSAGYINVTGGNYTINSNFTATGGYNAMVRSTLPLGTTLTINGTLNMSVTAGASDGLIIHSGAGTINITGNLNSTITGNLDVSCVRNAAGGTININGIITAGSGNGASCVLNLSSGTIIFQGSCITMYNLSNYPILNASTGRIIVNGDFTPAGAVQSTCIAGGAGIVTFNGNILGSLSTSPSTAFALSMSTGTATINGNVTQRSYGASTTGGLVNLAGTGTINITGNVSGGSVANTIAIANSSTGTINVTGNITGGSNATNTPAIYSTTAGTIDVTGTTTAGLYPALWSTSLTANNILRGNITNALGVPAYNAYKITVSPTAVQTATMQTTTNVDRLFSTSNVSVGAPATTNVRAGIVYGSTSELTGTMIVPTPANVRKGVPTDNTVGTADLTIAEFWDINASTLTTAGSIGDRVRNSATVESTGDQLAAF
jgi:hypothetical protein